jgi:cytochrome P450
MSITTDTPDEILRSALLTEEGRTDPYPILTRLHQHGEAAAVTLGYTAVWGYEAVNRVLRTPGLWKTHPDYELSTPYLRLTPAQVEELKAASGYLPRWLVFSNPPDHTRLRGLLSKAFTPRRMEAMRELVLDQVTKLLDDIDPTKPVDIVAALTAPLPQYLIGEIIGLSPTNADSFARHSREQSLLKDPRSTFEDKLDKMRDRAAWSEEIRELMAQHQRETKDDVINALFEANATDDSVSEAEMISLIMLLFAAGFDTSNNMMANGIHALLRHPDEMRLLAQNPSLARNVTEEVLRYDTPGFDTFYYAVGDRQIADCVVPDGSPIVLFLGVANYDPKVYKNPERFSILRDERGPLSFGAGAHLCLGVNLARLEGEILFSELAKRFPNMVLAEEHPRRNADIEFRGFESMQVLLQP